METVIHIRVKIGDIIGFIGFQLGFVLGPSVVHPLIQSSKLQH